MTDIVIYNAITPIVLILFLGLAGTLASLRFGINPIVGYIGVGVGLKAAHLDALFDESVIHLLAELGVMFLLFDLGLRFSPERVWKNVANILGFGPLQVAFASIAVGVAAAAMGFPALVAALIGITLSLSSTAVVERLIAERHQANCPVGVAASSILIFQDVAGMFVLVLAQALQSGQALFLVSGLAILKTMLAFAMTALASRCLVRPVLALIASRGNEEAITATALLVAVAAGWVTGLSGLSLTLGAFLAGVALGGTAYRPVVASEIRPFRILLLGFFFVSTGLSLDAHELAAAFWTVIGVALGLLAIKTLANIAASRLFSWSAAGSTQLGFLLGQGSELALIIFAMPASRQAIGSEMSSILIIAVTLTMLAAPSYAEFGRYLAGRLRLRAAVGSSAELSPLVRAAPVVIVGMGNVGRGVADALRALGVSYFAVERDHRRLRLALADGYDVAYGDGFDMHLWDALDLRERKLSVITASDYAALSQTAAHIRDRYPALKRFIVVNNVREARLYEDLGFVPVTDRDAVPGLDVSIALFGELRLPASQVAAWIQTHRRSAPKVLDPIEAA